MEPASIAPLDEAFYALRLFAINLLLSVLHLLFQELRIQQENRLFPPHNASQAVKHIVNRASTHQSPIPRPPIVLKSDQICRFKGDSGQLEVISSRQTHARRHKPVFHGESQLFQTLQQFAQMGCLLWHEKSGANRALLSETRVIST